MVSSGERKPNAGRTTGKPVPPPINITLAIWGECVSVAYQGADWMALLGTYRFRLESRG